MDFSVLTPDFRLQLEQQCDRLSSERDAIVQAAVEHATATIDASLAHINALLGNAPQSPDVKPSALGQFINYRGALRIRDPDRTLYLAIPDRTYDSFFQHEFTKMMVEENKVRLLPYNIETEVITQWIS